MTVHFCVIVCLLNLAFDYQNPINVFIVVVDLDIRHEYLGYGSFQLSYEHTVPHSGRMRTHKAVGNKVVRKNRKDI